MITVSPWVMVNGKHRVLCTCAGFGFGLGWVYVVKELSTPELEASIM